MCSLDDFRVGLVFTNYDSGWDEILPSQLIHGNDVMNPVDYEKGAKLSILKEVLRMIIERQKIILERMDNKISTKFALIIDFIPKHPLHPDYVTIDLLNLPPSEELEKLQIFVFEKRATDIGKKKLFSEALWKFCQLCEKKE